MKRALVAGCGFLGLELARQLHEAGWQVVGLTHSAETAVSLAGEPFAVRSCDISSRASVEQIAQTETGFDVVVHCASSGRGGVEDYRAVYLEGARQLQQVLQPARLIFTSSTSVYGQNDGGWVTEESPADPGRETGRTLREAEELVLAAGGSVLRLAALYGPGRSVLLRKFFGGDAVIEGDGGRWVNQIHRIDAASACRHVAEGKAYGLLNVADEQPTQQREIYQFLADRFHKPLPPFGEVNLNRKRGVTNKRVSSEKLRSSGWQPRYPSFLQAVEVEPELAALAQVEAVALVSSYAARRTRSGS